MKLIKSFGFAIKGIITGFKSEVNMKLHLLATFLVILMGFLFGITNIEWVVILISISLVISAELFNTAIEKIIDNITKLNPETYGDMGVPKDVSAGAVLIAAIVSALIGFIIFLPYIFKI